MTNDDFSAIATEFSNNGGSSFTSPKTNLQTLDDLPNGVDVANGSLRFTITAPVTIDYYTENASGLFELTSPTTDGFTDRILTNSNTVTANLTSHLRIADERESSAGWHVSVSASQFISPSFKTFPNGSLVLKARQASRRFQEVFRHRSFHLHLNQSTEVV